MALNEVGGAQCVSTAQVGIRCPHTFISKGRGPPTPAGQLAMPEKKPVPANWQEAALETQWVSLSAWCFHSVDAKFFLLGSIFSPFSNRFSYCVHNEVETVHLSPHTRVGSPDQPCTMLPFASFQDRAGHREGLRRRLVESEQR